ncbi:hypothetical protein [Isoalcanivorax indicus]|uniref:hypothetical protein n=1 Tax=Isoalcanivorax indicus TaxID=2202653 RepID=UPI0013C4F32A|nr:hypothetical protein [Isoalcanivorax indicus]
MDTGNRFEWRAFARHFGALEYRLIQHGRVIDIKVSQEWYLISRHNSDRNIKIRAGKLDTKTLVHTCGELEQWAPSASTPLPLTAQTFAQQALVPLGITPPDACMDNTQTLLDEHDLNTRFFYGLPDMVAVALRKRRIRYALNECLGEWVELDINGASLQSVCLESVHAEHVESAAALIGLEAWRNRSYVTALRETMGLIPQEPLLR